MNGLLYGILHEDDGFFLTKFGTEFQIVYLPNLRFEICLH